MKAEVEAYNAEKQRMKSVEVSDDDMIHLNVGGQKFTTKRSTLCQVEGSLLASMFSGRWEDGLERDQDGAVFFDFSPQYFGFILDSLRAKKIATPENPASMPKVPEDQVKNFNNLVEYLGLCQDEIVPTDPTEIIEIVPSEKFNLHSSGVTLQDDEKVALNSRTAHRYVLGENSYQQGVVKLKLELESFQNNDWIFVGMVKGHVPQNGNSCRWRGSYGWSLGSSSCCGVYKDTSFTNDDSVRNLTKQSDTVQLVLDCDAAKLSLHLPTGQRFHITDIPKSQTWSRLNVTLLGSNDKIRIVED